MKIPKWLSSYLILSILGGFIFGIILGFISGYCTILGIKLTLKLPWNFIQEHWPTLILASAAVISAVYAYHSNRRSRQLFVGQQRPLIQARPIAIKEHPEVNGVETMISVINYSGFVARNVSLDLRYGANDWIIEWIKANLDNIKSKGEKYKGYYLVSQGMIKELKPV